MATFDYDTDAVYSTDHEPDCDCEVCHFDWHNPLVDHIICTKCLHYMIDEVMRDDLERGTHGG